MNTLHTHRANVFLVVVSLLLHLLAVAGPAWSSVRSNQRGRDFASYYYAGRAAVEGEDPYDKRVLTRLAKADGVRSSVHPFFYPPPFLLGTVGLVALSLPDAYHLWFWLDELAAIAAMLTLFLLWRPLHPLAAGAIGLVFAALTAVPNNHVMGQANFPVLLFVLLALLADQRERQGLGGALLGLACMAKMSPALFVLWWLLRGRWVGVMGAVVTAVVVSVLTLPLVDSAHQLRFYTEVLPQFASGNYNGLTIPIGLFGNHSIPNLFDALFPSDGRGLSVAAQWASRGAAAALIALLAVSFRRPTQDGAQLSAQIATVGIVMLLIPVYTYEHHLIWAIPACVLVGLASLSGRLPWGAVVFCAAAVAAVCADLQDIKALAQSGPIPAFLLRESKFLGLLVLGISCTWLGSSRT